MECDSIRRGILAFLVGYLVQIGEESVELSGHYCLYSTTGEPCCDRGSVVEVFYAFRGKVYREEICSQFIEQIKSPRLP